ncbi:MAG TPA: hypothetical protein DCQ06_10695 [Myxococcales bacterium]|nr:hypothetical protein [Myxococcales bacterium]
MKRVRSLDRLRRALMGRFEADRRTLMRRFDGPSDRRGIVLVMTLLMMTMLTLLGSAAVLQTSNDIYETGAHRVERVVFRIAEAAAMGVVDMADSMGGRFDDFARSKNNTFTEADFGKSLMDLSLKAESTFGRELMAMGTSGFTVTVSPPHISTSIPGYEAGKYCFHSYTVTSLGQVGDIDSSKARDRALAGQAGISAQVVIGPVLCGN